LLVGATAADFDAFNAVHAQPGMPATGGSGTYLPLLAFLVGLVLLAGGAASRRVSAGAR